MHTLPETLRDNVRLLGELLGQVVIRHEGQALFDKVEQIRHVSKNLAVSKKRITSHLSKHSKPWRIMKSYRWPGLSISF